MARRRMQEDPPNDADAHGLALARAGRPAAARLAAAQALTEAEADGDARRQLRAHMLLATLGLETGTIAAAAEHARAVVEAALAAQQPAVAAYGQALEGKAWVLAGERERGLRAVAQALATLRQAGQWEIEQAALWVWAEALIAAGKCTEAAQALAAARAATPEPDRPDVVLRGLQLEAAIAMAARNPDATAVLDRLVAGARGADHPQALVHGLRWQGELLLRAGDPQAEARLSEAGRVAAEHGLWALAQEVAALGTGAQPAAMPVEARYRRMLELLPHAGQDRPLADMLAAALEGFLALAEAERAFLLMYDGFELTTQLAAGAASEADRTFSTSLAFQVLWSGEPLLLEDIARAGPPVTTASIEALGLLSALGVPLHHGREVIGVLLADSRVDRSPFSHQDLAVATAYAGQVAGQIVAARQLETASYDRDDARWLQALQLEAMQATTLEGVMRQVAPALAAHLAAERFIVLREPALEHGEVYDAIGRRVDDPRPASTGIAGWVRTHAKPMVIADVQHDASVGTRDSVRALGLRTAAAAPIRLGDRWFGVLYADGPDAAVPGPRAAVRLQGVADMLAATLVRQAGNTVPISST